MLSAVNDDGNERSPVDWWCVYQLPDHGWRRGRSHKENHAARPADYLYFDANGTRKFNRTYHTASMQPGAFHYTLNHVFSAAEKPQSTVGWLLYVDQANTAGTVGINKGLLAFDKEKDRGVWVLNVAANKNTAEYGEQISDAAQAFIGITLDSYKAASMIAAQLHSLQHVRVSAYKLPDFTPQSSQQDALYRFCTGGDCPAGNVQNQIGFKSEAGVAFKAATEKGQATRLDITGGMTRDRGFSSPDPLAWLYSFTQEKFAPAS